MRASGNTRPRAATGQPAGPSPISIVGLPRSGTTVLKRPLANHSRITSAGELMDFGRQLLRVGNAARDYGAAFFTRQLPLDFAEAGRGYLAQPRWRCVDKPYFTDKQPGNCTSLVHAALPEARIFMQCAIRWMPVSASGAHGSEARMRGRTSSRRWRRTTAFTG